MADDLKASDKKVERFRTQLFTHSQQLQALLLEWSAKQDKLLQSACIGGASSEHVELGFAGCGQQQNGLVAGAAPSNEESVLQTCKRPHSSLDLPSSSEPLAAAGPSPTGSRGSEASHIPTPEPSPTESAASGASHLPTPTVAARSRSFGSDVFQSGNPVAVFANNTVQFERKVQKGIVEFERELVSNKCFETFSALVIVANAMTIGMSAEYAGHNLEQSDNHPVLKYLELVFTLFYCFEVCMRMWQQRWRYFYSHDQWRWNIFDLMLVVQGVWEQVEAFLACTQYLQQDASDIDAPTQLAIEQYWNSVGQAVITIYAACMGGTDWEVVAEPLREVSLFFYLLFLFQIAMFSFVIMNTISSVFLEAMMLTSEKDQQAVIELHMEKKEMYIDKLQIFYDEIDDDGNGEIGYEEFMTHADSPHMLAFATSLEIDLSDAKQFFQVLSNNGSRTVDIETFVVGCIKLKGVARSMDLMDLVYSSRRAQHRQDLFAKDTMKKLDQLLQAASREVLRCPGRDSYAMLSADSSFASSDARHQCRAELAVSAAETEQWPANGAPRALSAGAHQL